MRFWSFTGKVIGVTAKVAVKTAFFTGKVAVKGAVKATKIAYDNREAIGKAATTTTKVAVATTAVAGYGAYKATEWTAKQIYDHRKEIAGVTVGVAAGTTGALMNSSGHFLDLKPRIERVAAQSAEYRKRTKTLWERLEGTDGHVCRRDVLLDTLVVGGSTLASYVDGSAPVPANVELAFKLAYPGDAARADFAHTVGSMNPDGLRGMVAGVKGKLFEIEYVNYLNDGHLPAHYTAKLAESATQPGWDIQILGPDGHTAELIQAKATESVGYVAAALERYPNIDVVTTSEVHGHLVMQGFADHVIDGGISDSALQASVEAAADGASVQFDWAPSVVTFALIAFSSYNKEGLDAYEKSRNFGERSSKSYLAYLAGGALAVATNTWWIGVIGGMGTRLVIGRGRRKWERKAELDRLIKYNDAILTKLPT